MENEEKQTSDELTTSVQGGTNLKSFEDLSRNSTTTCDIYTNITDKKQIFNLESKVDNLLNDCEGMIINVRGILLKIYKKPLKEPLVDEETGEILKDTETTMSCILVDEASTSYATGSKVFSIQLMNYIRTFGILEFNEGVNIKIVKNKTEKGNKALGFELV